MILPYTENNCYCANYETLPHMKNLGLPGLSLYGEYYQYNVCKNFYRKQESLNETVVLHCSNKRIHMLFNNIP